MVRRLEETFYAPLELGDVDAVVFDLDDTLLRHKAWIIAKVERVHADFPGKLPPLASLLSTVCELLENGQRHRLFDALSDILGLSDELKWDLIRAYRSAAPLAAPLFDDVLPLLTELRARGFKLGMLTDNPPESQRQKVALAGLSECFDQIVFSRESGAEKPSSAGFDEVANRLNLPCHRVVMVGDDVFRDARGALAAGYAHAFVVRREGAFHNYDLEVLPRAIPDTDRFTVVRGLIDLLPYLRSGPFSLASTASLGREAT
jgi:HAD superfamily hydrolase (TIGR01549 family)